MDEKGTNHFEEFLRRVVFFEVDRFDAELSAGDLQSFGHTIDADDSFGTENLTPASLEQADRPEAPDRHHRAFLHIANLTAVVRRRDDVRQVQRLHIGHIIRNGQAVHVSKGHSDIFGLTARHTTCEMGVAVESRRLLPVELLLEFGRVGRVTAGVFFPLAEVTGATGDVEGHDHPLTDLQRLHFVSFLLDDAHEFVSDDIAIVHVEHGVVVQMEIRSTDRRGRDFQQDIARIGDHRHRFLHVLDVPFASPNDGMLLSRFVVTGLGRRSTNQLDLLVRSACKTSTRIRTRWALFPLLCRPIVKRNSSPDRRQ